MDNQTHLQLQKGLEVITKTAKAINAKQVELSQVSEEVSSLREAVSKLRSESEIITSHLVRVHGEINIGETLIAQKKLELERLGAEERSLNLMKANTLNLATSASNSAEELTRIKNLSKNELEFYQALKENNLKEFLKTQKDLLDINIETAKAINKLAKLNESMKVDNQNLATKRRILDDKEAGLINFEKNLELKEQRLLKYAAELNLNLTSEQLHG